MKRFRFVIGCRNPHLSDKAGDSVILGLIAVIAGAYLLYSIYHGHNGDAAAAFALLMTIVNAIKEGRTSRSAERTIQQVTPSQSQGAAS